MSDILQRLMRPIIFVLKDPERGLRQVKGLERAIRALVRRALDSDPPPSEREVFEKLEGLFEDFEKKSFEEKREVILSAKALLDKYESSLKEEKGKWSARPLEEVKGIGPRTSRILRKRGIETIRDLLFFLPLRYEDRRELKKFFQILPGQWVTSVGQVLSIDVVQYPKSGKKVLEVLLGDGTGFILAKWFQGWDYLKRTLRVGQRVLFSGEVKGYFEQKEVIHPDIEILDDHKGPSIHFGRVVPVYSQSEGLKQKRLRSIMYQVVTHYASKISSPIPLEVEARLGLPPLEEALKEVHFPSDRTDLRELQAGTSPYHRRIAFEELFLLEVALALKRQGMKRAQGPIMRTERVELLDRFLKGLPFELTRAQRRVLDELRKDLSGPHPMYRLLQGDVGSGKTVVALCGAMIAIENGYQVAFMAPTEILAEQHFQTALELTSPLGLRVALLTSKVKGRDRERIIEETANGRVSILIGTHALIQEGVSFGDLGLVVVDEQHRFGVLQRAKLYQKGRHPHLLVMTATPIPRTLAMTLYGDMEVSVLDQMPPGRGNITTKVFFESEREEAYRILEEEVQKGNQAYVVYPLIEESEQMALQNAKEGAEALRKRYPTWRIGLLHGRMPSEEKEKVMRAFKTGEIQVLVSTTVIEVGIDVPRATVMLVEEAHRFGLAQLHQLRGRVGRGPHPSYCLLLARGDLGDVARRRLQVMEETRDGFRIAEEDLILRGPGDLLGVRQWGLPKFRVAELPRDLKLLMLARREAFRLVKEDPGLNRSNHRFLKQMVFDLYGDKLDLANIG